MTINLTAVVDDVVNPNGVPLGNIEPGATITGSYTYNPETKDTDPSVSLVSTRTTNPTGAAFNSDIGKFLA